ncbi:MAG: hypothetical protein KF841_07470 [Phycisphaerae bacterium]|nr:hypothetical protein [Phycisphaerae bacterium]
MEQAPSFSRRAVTKMEVVALVWVLGLAAYCLVPAVVRSRIEANRAACLSNLTSIGKALSSYMENNDGRWPFVAKLRSVRVGDQSRWSTLPAVLSKELSADSPVYHCPADARRNSSGGSTPGLKGNYYSTEGLSYEWWWGEARGGRRIGEESISKASGFGFGRADQRVLSDFEPFHDGDGGGAINSLYADFVARSSRGG